MKLENFPQNYRVCFRRGFQRKFMNEIRKPIFSQNSDTHWTLIVAKKLRKNPATIYDYWKENHRLGVRECLLLLEFFPIMKNTINDWIEDIKSPSELRAKSGYILAKRYPKEVRRKWAQKAGKISGAKNLLKGREYFVEIGKLGKIATYKKYKDKTSEWGLKGGLKIAEVQPLTKQEKKIVDLNKKFDITFKTHYSLRNLNFDFVYFSQDKPLIFEEVTDEPPYRGYLFQKLVDLYERLSEIKKINPNGILLFTLRFKKRTSKCDIIVPVDIIRFLLELDIIPVFMDIKRMVEKSRMVIESTLENENSKFLIELKDYIQDFVSTEFEKRKNRKKAMSIREMKSEFNENEEKVHNILMELQLNPKGKTILEKNNEAFIVLDNYFELNRQRYSVLVTTNTKNSYTLAKRCGTVAGYCFAIKKFFDPEMKCITIIMNSKENSKPIGRHFYYLRKYSDLITVEDNLKIDLQKFLR